MIRIWIAALVLALPPTDAAFGYDLRRCLACNAACQDDALRGDDACCRDARGSQTKDYCFAQRPSQYAACAKDLATARLSCQSTCSQTFCAR